MADAGMVGELAQDGGADASHAKSESEEKPGDQSHFSGQQLLRVYQDGGKGRGEDDPDEYGQDSRPEKIGKWQQQGEGGYSENGEPDDVLAADAVADRAADEGAGGDGEKEQEEQQLGVLDGDMEFIDQIEHVIAAHGGHIEIF